MFLSSLQLARLVPLRVMLPALPLVYRELEGGGKVGGVGWDELGGHHCSSVVVGVVLLLAA